MNRWIPALLSLVPFVPSEVQARPHGPPHAAERRPPRRPGPPPPRRAPVPDAIRLRVVVVRASEGPPHVDPELRSLEPHLRYLKYDDFRLQARHVSRLEPADETEFVLDVDRRVRVTLLSRGPARATCRVQMFGARGKLIDTTVSINRNSTFILAGPERKRSRLILAITASY